MSTREPSVASESSVPSGASQPSRKFADCDQSKPITCSNRATYRRRKSEEGGLLCRPVSGQRSKFLETEQCLLCATQVLHAFASGQPLRELGCAQQLFTQWAASAVQIAVGFQRLAHRTSSRACPSYSYMDRVRHTSPPKVRGTTGRKDRRKKRKGGWRSPSGLAWSEVKGVSSVAHSARFNTYLDIMPVSGTDQERKRYCALIVARLGQSLKRRGRQHVGVTTYEKSSVASLHAHHMCRLEKCDWDLLQRYDGEIVRADTFPLSRLSQVVRYRTKQRLPLSPEVRKKHQPSATTRRTNSRSARILYESRPDSSPSTFGQSLNPRSGERHAKIARTRAFGKWTEAGPQPSRCAEVYPARHP